MTPNSQTILTVLQGIYRYVKKNYGGLISAVGGLISAWRSFFRPAAKCGGLISGWGDFFRGSIFRYPRKKELRKKDRNLICRSFFRGDYFRRSFYFRSFFCSRGGVVELR